MLQQTQVDRVRPRYVDFLDRFPTLQSLAEASTADVLRSWQGLGYNRRALNLKRAAETACRDHHGCLPSTVGQLETFPGIGRYTAQAVACFAFGVQVPVVDTNVRRMLSGFAGRDLTEKETETLAEELLPKGRAADWNQALMDYGAVVYKAKPKRTGKRQEPFQSTNRFWRGRIVDALRQHDSVNMSALLELLTKTSRATTRASLESETYRGADEVRVRRLVHALHEEGLVRYDPNQDTVGLPSS